LGGGVSPIAFRRPEMWQALSDAAGKLDFVVIGGGATGTAAALEAASRGYTVALVEAEDFAAGTSSRSTKMVHGGVRYLRRGEFKLVREALQERATLRRMAPHLVHQMRLVLPTRRFGERAFYSFGLTLYDWLSGGYRWTSARGLSRKQAVEAVPGLRRDGLRGGVAYSDGQFDDARLALAFGRTAAVHGALVLNHAAVTGLTREDERTIEVQITDRIEGRILQLRPRLVLNCTGPGSDRVRQLADPALPSVMRLSRGSHLVLPAEFLGGDTGLILPETRDGRVLFALPWQGRVLLGTTEVPVEQVEDDPQVSDEEIYYLLEESKQLLERAPTRDDVVATFVGLRPLVSADDVGDTAALSREHVILEGPPGMLTMAGGKWTTARRMGEELIDSAARSLGDQPRPSGTAGLRVVGGECGIDCEPDPYGSERAAVEELCASLPGGGEPVAPGVALRRGEVAWMVREEMAVTADDVLYRRARLGVLDARATAAAREPVTALIRAFSG